MGWRRGGILLVAVAMPVSALLAAAPEGARVVRYEEGRLTVHLERVPLDDVLAALQLETGMEVRGQLRDWREVSHRFDGVPLPQALDRLLGNQNFTLTYGRGGRPLRLKLLGVPQQLPAAKPQRPARARVRASLAQAIAARGPVEIPPRLARALGAGRVPLTRLLTAGARERDAEVRAEALETFVRTVERDAGLRRAFRQTGDGMVLNFVRALAHERSAEVLSALAGLARDPGLRARAKGALGRLQAGRATQGVPGA